jgi:hypothetical protein
MANCPNCGSNHIQLRKETDVNWGRAVVGWAVFGVVGGAVGAVTGENRDINACLDCGTSWKAADLHKLLQIIQKLTNLRIDLYEEVDRIFINDFISEFSSDLENISYIEKKGQKSIKEIQNKSNENVSNGCMLGCGASILLLVTFGITAGTGFFIGFLVLALPVVGMIIGGQIDTAGSKSVEQKIEKIKREMETKKLDAEENLKAKVVQFMSRHPLIDQEHEWVPQPEVPPKIFEEAPIGQVLVPEYCPRCDRKLPPPFQSSNRIVCSKCGWSNKPKK